MTAFWESTQRAMQRDLIEKQDAWLQQRADDLGLSIEEMAARYYLEHDTVDLMLVGTTLRAVKTLRLVRRDKHAEVVTQPKE